MWTRFLLLPWWTRALLTAGVYAIQVTADWLAADLPQNFLSQLLWDAAIMVIFGLVVAANTANSHRIYADALAGLDPAQRSVAVRASFRGPVPADGFVRVAAIRISERRLYLARFWRVMWLVVVCLGLGFFALGRYLNGTSGWQADDWIGEAIVLCVAVTAWYVFLRIGPRLQTLRYTGAFAAMGVAEPRRGPATL